MNTKSLRQRALRCVPFLTLLLASGCASSHSSHSKPSAPSSTCESREAAMHRVIAAARDRDEAEALLGSDGFELLRSGDEDGEDVSTVSMLADDKLAFDAVTPDRCIALIGHEAWEFPIPLVRDGEGWRFDVEAGREEVRNRRVGRNELSTIATLYQLVAAQREYAAEGRDGNAPRYARRFQSSPGKRDGLYWPTAEGEPKSPLGPLLAEAADEDDGTDAPASPYHGYHYRLLTAQGASAPGGARDYFDANGRQPGFAAVAWPAAYGDSGVMTFVVNHQGIVFQRDVGDETDGAVAAMRVYDPDGTWMPTDG